MEQGNRNTELSESAVSSAEQIVIDNFNKGVASAEKLGNPEVSGEVFMASVAPQLSVDEGSSQVVNNQALGLPTPVDTATGDSNPAIAEDNDLIEAEWVKRAKEIVSENKKDPYQQGESVAGLKVDYLKKRFGREIGKNN